MAFDRGVTMLAPAPGAAYACPSGAIYVADQRGFIFGPAFVDVEFLSALGCRRTSPRNEPGATRGPNLTDDETQLYGVGSIWVYSQSTDGPAIYCCIDPTEGAAVWVLVVSADGVPADISIATVLPTGATVRIPIQDYLAELGTNVHAYGAQGDGITDDSGHFMAAIKSSLQSGNPVYVPAGHYIMKSPLDIDISSAAPEGLWITGASAGHTIIDGSGLGAPVLRIFGGGGTVQNQTNCFYGGLRDFQVLGNTVGPVLDIGTANFADAINSYEIKNLNIKNQNTGAAAVGTRINYLVSSKVDNLVTNCAGKGDALQLNQCALTTFLSGSYSTADNGIHITNGYTFGCAFKGADVENTAVCIVQDSSHAQYNTFEGGSFVWSKFAVSSSAGGTGALTMDRVNLGTQGLYTKGGAQALDPNNIVNVRFLGNYGDGSTPDMPPSGTAVRNVTGQAQIVTFWGNGTDLKSVTINGAQTMSSDTGLTSFTIQLRPGYTISWAGTGTPSWVWYPLDS
jgi:hypothetical protein